MSENALIEIAGVLTAAVGFFFVWWRLRDIEELKGTLARQNKMADELRHLRSDAHGKIWTLTGALNLFGPSSDIDLSDLSDGMASWYFTSGEALGPDVRDHYFVLQEAISLCLMEEINPMRPANDRILGAMADTEYSAVVRLNRMRKAAFGPATKPIFDANGNAEVTSLRDLLNDWRLDPGPRMVPDLGELSREERAWLLLQWLMSLLRSRLRSKRTGK